MKKFSLFALIFCAVWSMYGTSIVEAKLYSSREITNLQVWANAVDASADGQHIIVSDGGIWNGSHWSQGRIFFSHNMGGTWSQATALGEGKWRAVAISDDGKIMYAAPSLDTPNSQGSIRVSKDSGQTWSPVSDLGASLWSYIDTSSDGKHVAAVDYNTGGGKYVYVSHDTGQTWTQLTVTNSWSSDRSGVYISDDGMGIYIRSSGIYPGRLTQDGGITWVDRSEGSQGIPYDTKIRSTFSGDLRAKIVDENTSWNGFFKGVVVILKEVVENSASGLSEVSGTISVQGCVLQTSTYNGISYISGCDVEVSWEVPNINTISSQKIDIDMSPGVYYPDPATIGLPWSRTDWPQGVSGSGTATSHFYIPSSTGEDFKVSLYEFGTKKLIQTASFKVVPVGSARPDRVIANTPLTRKEPTTSSTTATSTTTIPVTTLIPTSTLTPTSTPIARGFCPVLSQNLSIGSSGAQVTQLQKFFSSYYRVNQQDIVTGNFGQLTKSYAIRFQTEQVFASGGSVGPLTRARIARVCGQTSTPVITSISTATPYGTIQANTCSTAVAGGTCPVIATWTARNSYLTGTTPFVAINVIDNATHTFYGGSAVPGVSYYTNTTSQSGTYNFNLRKGNYRLDLYGWANGAHVLLGSQEVVVSDPVSVPTPCGNGIGCTLPTTSSTTTTSTVPLQTTIPVMVVQPTTQSSTPIAQQAVTGSISASACTIGSGSTLVPGNNSVCDSTVTWSTSGATNAYVVITGDYPYNNTGAYPYGFTLPPGTSGNTVKFWTPAGTYKVALYVNGVWPTLTAPGTGNKVRELSITVNGTTITTPLSDSSDTSCTTNRLAGAHLLPGQSLASCNGRYHFTFAADGNLTLTGAIATLWSANTAGLGGIELAMQTDGNLVLYNASNQAVWSTGKMGPAQYLQLKNDGTLGVYSSSGTLRWDTTMPPYRASAPTGSISTITPCTPGLGRSTVDTANAAICDQSISWTTTNATNVKVVITGASPYTSTAFPNGYTAGTGVSGSGTFWVTSGTYTATLYSGTTVLDTRSFTISAPITQLLTQVANVLEGIQSLLRSWRR